MRLPAASDRACEQVPERGGRPPLGQPASSDAGTLMVLLIPTPDARPRQNVMVLLDASTLTLQVRACGPPPLQCTAREVAGM